MQLARDIAKLLDVLIGNIEVWSDAFDLDEGEDTAIAIAEELGLGLLELVGSSWVRFRWPRVYLGLEALATLTDTTSQYGVAGHEYQRLGQGVGALFAFLLQPGKTLSALDTGTPWDERGHQTILDAQIRLFAAMVGVVETMKAEDFEDIGFLHDVYSGWDHRSLSIESREEPTVADLVSTHMVSFALGRETPERPEALSSTERVLVTVMWVPQEDGSPAFLVALGGSVSIDEKLNPRWKLSGQLRGDAGIAAVLGGGITDLAPGFGDAVQKVRLSSNPDVNTAISFSIPDRVHSRLELGQVALEFELGGSTGVSLTASLVNAVLVLDGQDVDGFVKRLLPDDPVRLPFNLTLGYGSERGLIVEGSVLPLTGAGPGARNSPLGGNRNADAPVVNATIPLGKRLGPVTVHEVAITIAKGTPDAPGGDDVYSVAADVSFSAQLGPAYFRLDQVGLGTVVDWAKPPSERNLHFVDASFGINPPLGIAVNVDADQISGGGVLFHDPVAGTYAGALALRLDKKFTLKAIGLVATRRPDGTEGSSFIIIATLEGQIQMGPFTLRGLGLLFASDRTFDEDAMRAALPTGQLRTVLFPPDPVHNFTAVQRSLDTFFPAQPDSYLFGLLVAMVFGTDNLIRLDLALVLQWGDSVSNRLIVLGRVSSLLPDEAAPVLRINLDAVGIFDPSAGVVALDAVLVDSKLVGRFALTGSAAFRRTPGSGGFALSVGGFHPSFRPPDGFPALRRITLALTSGDNPKLICEAYLAVTANTLQIGASATLYASACGFSIDGNIGFDALIEPLRFRYLAEFRASIQLKRGSRNLFKVSVSGALEGSLPLRVRGRASFEICWCDFSVGFDKTLLGGSSDRQLPVFDALLALLQQLREPAHWVTELPRAALSLVSVRAEDLAEGRILLHPMGRVTVKQGAVPLNLSRDIDRIGAATPSGDRRFAITHVTVGTNEQVPAFVRDFFAPAQFFDLTDDEKLAAPSFEEMDAGVAFGDADYTFVDGQRQSSPFDYTDIVIGADGTPTEEEEPHHADGAWVIRMLAFGAAAQAPTRRGASDRFAAAPREDVPGLRPRGWAVAEAGSTEPATVAATWAEAKSLAGLATTAGPRVLVPTALIEEG